MRKGDTDQLLSEHDIVFDYTHGHTHDGQDSALISKAPKIHLADLSEDVLALIRSVMGATGGLKIYDYPFVQSQQVIVDSSARWYAPTNLTLFQVFASVDTVGTTDTIITVYKNGVSIGTVTITATQNTGSTNFSISFTTTDYLTIGVTTAGAGALKLDAQARLQ